MDVDLIEQYSQSSVRIDTKWRTSILINALILGWVIALYIGLFQDNDLVLISIYLKLLMTSAHLVASGVSCINLWNEYEIFNGLKGCLEQMKYDSKLNEDVAGVLLKQSYTMKLVESNPKFIAFLLHAIYGIFIYSVIWLPYLFVGKVI